MKQHFAFLTAIFVLGVQAGDAQIVRQFGCRIAASSTNQTFIFPHGESTTSAKRLLIFDGGIYAEMFSSSHFSFVLAAEYQQRAGGKAVSVFIPNDLESRNIQMRIHYISFPLLLKYRYELDGIIPYVLSGLTINYPAYDFKYFPWVLGATLGGGLEFMDMLPFTIMVDIRYSFDLTYTFEDFYGDYDVRSNAIDFGIAFAFWLGNYISQ